MRRDGVERIIAGTLRAVDIWSAILLLTGQLTVGGVFFSSGAIWFSLIGPIFGNVRIEGTSSESDAAVNAVDIITALLLILGQITNTGPWITSGRFNLTVSGPAFGNSNVPVPYNPFKLSKKARGFFDDFYKEVVNRELNNRSKL